MEINVADFDDEIESFKEYGPYTWVETNDLRIKKTDTKLIWSSFTLNDSDYIANYFEEGADANGYFIATKPYELEENTVFVTTHINVLCEECEGGGSDCSSCDGDGDTWIDIIELSSN